MILLLTKKADNFFNKPRLVSFTGEKDSLYTWIVNISEFKNENLLVFINEASRYVVGVLDPQINQDLSDSLFTTLRDTMLSDNINPAIIDAYINNCGETQLFLDPGSTETSWLIAATKNAWRYYDRTEENQDLSRFASRLLVSPVSISGNYKSFRPCDFFYSILARYGFPLYGGKAFDLNVRLCLDGRDAVRKLRVSANITFEQLHFILQSAFGWSNYHLHSFGMFNEWSDEYGAKPVEELVCHGLEEEEDPIRRLSANIKLSEYIPKYSKILYTYDYEESWCHYIEVDNVIDSCQEELPILLSGEGDSPPEDVGGTSGFLKFLDIISNPRDPERTSMLHWAASLGWSHFEFEKVARNLKK